MHYQPMQLKEQTIKIKSSSQGLIYQLQQGNNRYQIQKVKETVEETDQTLHVADKILIYAINFQLICQIQSMYFTYS